MTTAEFTREQLKMLGATEQEIEQTLRAFEEKFGKAEAERLVPEADIPRLLKLCKALVAMSKSKRGRAIIRKEALSFEQQFEREAKGN